MIFVHLVFVICAYFGFCALTFGIQVNAYALNTDRMRVLFLSGDYDACIAEGEKLPLTQRDVQPIGASLVCRIYAEDPETNFLPSTGRIERLQISGGAWDTRGPWNLPRVHSPYRLRSDYCESHRLGSKSTGGHFANGSSSPGVRHQGGQDDPSVPSLAHQQSILYEGGF